MTRTQLGPFIPLFISMGGVLPVHSIPERALRTISAFGGDLWIGNCQTRKDVEGLDWRREGGKNGTRRICVVWTKVVFVRMDLDVSEERCTALALRDYQDRQVRKATKAEKFELLYSGEFCMGVINRKGVICGWGRVSNVLFWEAGYMNSETGLSAYGIVRDHVREESMFVFRVHDRTLALSEAMTVSGLHSYLLCEEFVHPAPLLPLYIRDGRSGEKFELCTTGLTKTLAAQIHDHGKRSAIVIDSAGSIVLVSSDSPKILGTVTDLFGHRRGDVAAFNVRHTLCFRSSVLIKEEGDTHGMYYTYVIVSKLIDRDRPSSPLNLRLVTSISAVRFQVVGDDSAIRVVKKMRTHPQLSTYEPSTPGYMFDRGVLHEIAIAGVRRSSLLMIESRLCSYTDRHIIFLERESLKPYRSMLKVPDVVAEYYHHTQPIASIRPDPAIETIVKGIRLTKEKRLRSQFAMSRLGE